MTELSPRITVDVCLQEIVAVITVNSGRLMEHLLDEGFDPSKVGSMAIHFSAQDTSYIDNNGMLRFVEAVYMPSVGQITLYPYRAMLDYQQKLQEMTANDDTEEHRILVSRDWSQRYSRFLAHELRHNKNNPAPMQAGDVVYETPTPTLARVAISRLDYEDNPEEVECREIEHLAPNDLVYFELKAASAEMAAAD